MKKKFYKIKYEDWEISYYPISFNFKIFIVELNKFLKKKNTIEFSNFLNKLGNYGIIARKHDFTFACVDRISSFPIFYKNLGDNKVFSENWSDLHTQDMIIEKNKETEFLMSGYISGSSTLFKEIKQIEAGSFVTNKMNSPQNFYMFYPNEINHTSKDKLIDQLNSVTNKIFNKLYKKYEYNQIIVPLSGGLDSRFVLAKLCEYNFRDILALSYGPKDNAESKVAKKISKKLNIK